MLAYERIRFGANDSPTCPMCSMTMGLTRRVPHPHYGYDYELQSFECRSCGLEVKRSADIVGLPHASDAGLKEHASLK
jgi:C4-type Zn-finger protein